MKLQQSNQLGSNLQAKQVFLNDLKQYKKQKIEA